LVWLTETVSSQLTVLDYGCGSGILAIAAKKLGAAEVVGTDIDHQAIQSSLYNAQQNSVYA
jgi:ribosomal protein L11 methyltransferase